MRRLLVPIVVVVLTGAVVAGLVQAGDKESAGAGIDLQDARERLRGAPAPLAELHARSAQLLASGFRARLRRLRGHPVVVNKWASWCGPCRAEFPMFARQAVEHGKQVAFVGLDFDDGRAPAEEFLASSPVPYPSYEDPDGSLSDSVGIPKIATPGTVFLDRDSRVVHRKFGEYRSEEDLRADIMRYAR
jgi:cytochrome c biogenesis protein CcmG/thiol:disulfide interchange protein DsbE